jgi:hypothetical protein
MTDSNNSFIITPSALSVVIDGKPYAVDNQHPNYEQIVNAIKRGVWGIVPNLINVGKTFQTFAENTDILVDMAGESIWYKGERVHNTMVQHILSMIKEGFDATPMTNFLQNMYDNVSKKAINELYSFLEYGKMPITGDGYFLAYKRVNVDYTSCFDGVTENKIGTVVDMPRNQVDDRSHVTCSQGLHICSFEYLRHYRGARVIVVKVNPADVVSIPTDYNNTKARVCRYEVVGELTFEEAGLDSHTFGKSVINEFDQGVTKPYVDELIEPVDIIQVPPFKTDDGSLFPSHFELDAPEELQEVIQSGELSDWLQEQITSGAATILAIDTGDAFDSTLSALTASNEAETGLVEFLRYCIAADKEGSVIMPSDGSDGGTVKIKWPELDTSATDMLATTFHTSVSNYYKVGYTNGYRHGRDKLPVACASTTVSAPDLTVQDIMDLNAGYSIGYVDGKTTKNVNLKKQVK